jgi:hypothetical protein
LLGEHRDEPERAREKDAFAAGEAVDASVLLREIAQDETVHRELPANRLDGGDDPFVRRGEEADERHQEDARVELGRAEALRERLLLGVPGLRQDVGVDLVSERGPAFHRPFAAELRAEPDGAIERDPGHDLRVREVTVRAADLPDPGVLRAPARLEPVEELPDERPRVVVGLPAVQASAVERVHHLAVHVELELLRGGVADPDGRGSLVAG